MTISDLGSLTSDEFINYTKSVYKESFSNNYLTQVIKGGKISTLLKTFEMFANWPNETLGECPVDRVKIAKNILSTGCILIHTSREVEPKLSVALRSLEDDTNQEESWRTPLEIVQDIINISKRILHEHISQNEFLYDESLKYPQIEDKQVLKKNIQAIYDSQYKSTGLTASETLELTNVSEASYAWKIITSPSYLWWKEDESAKLREIKSYQLTTLATLRALEALVNSKPKAETIQDILGENLCTNTKSNPEINNIPLECFALRLLKNKNFKLNEKDSTVQKLQKEIEACANNILKTTLPNGLDKRPMIKKNEIVMFNNFRKVDFW